MESEAVRLLQKYYFDIQTHKLENANTSIRNVAHIKQLGNLSQVKAFNKRRKMDLEKPITATKALQS